MWCRNSVHGSENCTCFNRIADGTVNAGDSAVLRSNDRDLHLHRFDDDDRVALADCIAGLLFDLEDLTCRTCGDLDGTCACRCLVSMQHLHGDRASEPAP